MNLERHTPSLLTALQNVCASPARHRRVTEIDEEPAIHALVDAWAAKTGKTGKRWSQSRQAARRKIRRSGLTGSYAQTLRSLKA